MEHAREWLYFHEERFFSASFIKKRQLNTSTNVSNRLIDFQKTEILFLSDWLSKHVDGGGACGKARIGADVPENFKSTLNDVVERNICKHARMNNLMRSGRTLINGCYHPAGCSGIS